MKLSEDEKRVLELILEGRLKELKPVLVHNSLKTLTDKRERSDREHFLGLKQMTEEIDKNVQKELNRVRELITPIRIEENLESLNPYSFSQELCDSELMTLQDQGKSIRMAKLNYSNMFSLVSPSLSQTLNKKIRLKVKNTNGCCMFFGVASRSEILRSNFEFPRNEVGVHVIGTLGWVYNHRDPDEHQREGDFEINQGDEIEM